MEENKEFEICKLLGVEVGEIFEINNQYGEFRINCDGILEEKIDNAINDLDWEYNSTTYALCYAINNKGMISHKHNWTVQDIEDAKAVKQLFSCDGCELEIIRDGGIIVGIIYGNDEDYKYLPSTTFASVKEKERVKLSDILNED